MIISDRVWMRIRDQFSEDEKVALRSVITGDVLCPAGVEIDANRLEAGLADKLTQALLAEPRA